MEKKIIKKQYISEKSIIYYIDNCIIELNKLYKYKLNLESSFNKIYSQNKELKNEITKIINIDNFNYKPSTQTLMLDPNKTIQLLLKLDIDSDEFCKYQNEILIELEVINNLLNSLAFEGNYTTYLSKINNIIRGHYYNIGLSGECGISLEEYKKNDLILELSCNHKFHYNCCVQWLQNNISCPYCR